MIVPEPIYWCVIVYLLAMWWTAQKRDDLY